MYNGSKANAIIPEDVDVIGEKAFLGCKFIENIMIPNSVNRIEKYAFQQCSGIKELVIPDSVTFIGESAFKWCYSLTSITIPNSITMKSDRLFFEIFSLRKVNLPDPIIKIGDRVFYKCESLESVKIPPKITEVLEGMFQDCINLIEVKAPGKISEIHEKGFYGCNKLKYIELSPEFNSFGDFALFQCYSIKKDIFLPLNLGLKIEKPNQVWITLETPKYLGTKSLTNFSKVNNLVLTCNNFQYVEEGLLEPINVTDSHTFIFTNESQENQTTILSLSSEFSIEAYSVDNIMVNIDRKIREMNNVRDNYGTNQFENCMLMYFRLRYSYELEESVKESYISVLRKHFKIIVEDLSSPESCVKSIS
jgi:hypothetical protein